jgi:hypothetical protein
MLILYHSGEYRKDRLVLRITVVLRVVPIYNNIYIILCCSSCENRRQKPFWDTNTAKKISSERDDEKCGGIRRSESLRGYIDRKVLDLTKVNRFERSEILGG